MQASPRPPSTPSSPLEASPGPPGMPERQEGSSPPPVVIPPLSSTQLVRQIEGREAQFDSLFTEFGVPQPAREKILAGGVVDLQDFRYFFTKDEDVTSFLADVLLGDQRGLVESRVRRAWHSTRAFFDRREASAATSHAGTGPSADSDDWDSPLKPEALRHMETRFIVVSISACPRSFSF